MNALDLVRIRDTFYPNALVFQVFLIWRFSSK